MTSTITAAANPAALATVEGFPSINQEAAGLLKMVWRLSEIEDDWTKGGSIHPAWDRWTYWPYMAKVTQQPYCSPCGCSARFRRRCPPGARSARLRRRRSPSG